MEKSYEFKFPFKRTLSANTLCVVGVCTCLMMKMAVEKAFKSLGITDYSVEPATGDNPLGTRLCAPDILFYEALQPEELKARAPGAMTIEIKDISNQSLIKDEIIKAFTLSGWLVEK